MGSGTLQGRPSRKESLNATLRAVPDKRLNNSLLRGGFRSALAADVKRWVIGMCFRWLEVGRPGRKPAPKSSHAVRFVNSGITKWKWARPSKHAKNPSLVLIIRTRRTASCLSFAELECCQHQSLNRMVCCRSVLFLRGCRRLS